MIDKYEIKDKELRKIIRNNKFVKTEDEMKQWILSEGQSILDLLIKVGRYDKSSKTKDQVVKDIIKYGERHVKAQLELCLECRESAERVLERRGQ